MRDHKHHRSPANNRQLAYIWDQGLDPAFVWSLDGTVLFWNRLAERLYGFVEGESYGNNCHELLQTVFPDGVTCDDVVRCLQREKIWQGELLHTAKDGRTIFVESRMRLTQGLKTKLVLQSNSAAVERRQAIHRIEVLEEERRRLAQELHDEIGQVLSTAVIDLHSAKDFCGAAVGTRLDDSIHVLERSIEQIRNRSFELWPSILNDLGLVSAIRWYADRQALHAGLILDFGARMTGSPLSSDLKLTCYRVVQESVTNVLRHSQAKHIWLELEETSDQIRLTIRDDGIGFDQRRCGQCPRFGLRGMQDRVKLQGGQLIIESWPDQGTVVNARMPTRKCS